MHEHTPGPPATVESESHSQREGRVIASATNDATLSARDRFLMARARALDRERLAALRRFLLLTLMVGIVGMGPELLSIGHVEDRLQLVPIVLLPGGFVALAWHTLRPSSVSAHGVRLLMTLFVARGAGTVPSRDRQVRG